MITVIIPSFNEEQNSFFAETMELLSTFEPIEVIIVDYSSTDNTKQIVEKYKFNYCLSTNNSRAARINEGIKAATNNFILIHHPRSALTKEAIQ